MLGVRLLRNHSGVSLAGAQICAAVIKTGANIRDSVFISIRERYRLTGVESGIGLDREWVVNGISLPGDTKVCEKSPFRCSGVGTDPILGEKGARGVMIRDPDGHILLVR